tara:strand:+ start:171 stop:551 length:381 start_codon:yes stop_codon:yes gene_type:complete
MAKNVGGRPTCMTPEVIQKLEDAFSWGCTDLEACCNADISKSTLYNYCDANPKFMERKEVLKNQPVMKARRVVLAALDDDDINTAHKVIDRKEGMKVKQEVTSPDGSMTPTFVFNPVGRDEPTNTD